MATQSVTKPSKPALKAPGSGSVARLVESLMSKSFLVTGDKLTYFHGYSDDEVRGIQSDAANWCSAAMNGLEYASSAMAAHDDSVAEFNRAGAAWLVAHLSEEIERARFVEVTAITELARRGYDEHGKPL